jgi:hypothetical protein
MSDWVGCRDGRPARAGCGATGAHRRSGAPVDRMTALSRRHGAELIATCLDAKDVGWAVVYGISDNPRQFWDLSHARELLGWAPKDRAPN